MHSNLSLQFQICLLDSWVQGVRSFGCTGFGGNMAWIKDGAEFPSTAPQGFEESVRVTLGVLI